MKTKKVIEVNNRGGDRNGAGRKPIDGIERSSVGFFREDVLFVKKYCAEKNAKREPDAKKYMPSDFYRSAVGEKVRRLKQQNQMKNGTS